METSSSKLEALQIDVKANGSKSETFHSYILGTVNYFEMLEVRGPLLALKALFQTLGIKLEILGAK